jgi:dCTP diphosphatase
MSFAELQSEIRAFVDVRNWRQFQKPKDLAISISLEASELLEHFQWKDGENLDHYLKNNKEDLQDEMADVMIYLISLAETLDVDMIEACRAKIIKNAVKYPEKEKRDFHAPINDESYATDV